jgi:hypothetical protein
MEDQVPVLMSPSDRVPQLYSQAPGSLFVALYDSQGYVGGTSIITRIHTALSHSINIQNLNTDIPLLKILYVFDKYKFGDRLG